VLEELFAPRSVAVVGASRDPTSVGQAVLRNLIDGGFPGPVLPVNPAATELLGLKCYASLRDAPPPVDLAVVAVPAHRVTQVIHEAAEVGVRAAIIISAGFRETGPDGARLERDVLDAARTSGIRILGPNCLGVISTPSRLNASFAPVMPQQGGISFISQSGALGTAALDWAAGKGLGLAHFASLGNKADISEVDLIQAWTDDLATRVVVAYLESVIDGRAFVEAVQRLVRRVPFIAITAGASDAGARAVSSHTGSLAGSRVTYQAAFRKAGAISVETVEALFDLAEGFALQPAPSAAGTVILTNAGGPGILAADACEAAGLTLAALEPSTIRGLRSVLPPAAAVYNPVDVLGDADPARYAEAVRLLAADPNVHSLIVLLTPQAMTDPVGTAREVVRALDGAGVTTLASFMGDITVAPAVEVLREGGIPAYPFPERAVATLAAMQRHGARSIRPEGAGHVHVHGERATVREAIDHARAARRAFITEESARRIAVAYGIRVPAGALVTDLDAAYAAADRIGYPVVLKVASPDILHKSDIGAIALGIRTAEELREAYERILANVRTRMPDAQIWGIAVHEQVRPGREVIIGMNRDPRFGPVVMFGLGGIYVEVLKDVSFRLAPVTPTEALEMVREVRSYPLLRGSRGDAPADLDAIVDVICRVSQLASDFEDILELDINPLIVHEKGSGALAADIRIGIELGG
jgi:acetyltransferase